MKRNIHSFLLFFLPVICLAQQSYPITFQHDGKTVYGTFTTPDGSGKFPAIIINPGSGANDRDGTIQMIGGNVLCLYPDLVGETLTPYKDLSDALVDSGYAVLRYDKLEFTYPTTLAPITFHKLWLPVESAIAYVKTRTDVDTNRIILIGHSEGSSLIPFIAENRTDIKALISIAGPRTPFDSIYAYQIVEIAQTCNGDTVQAQNTADDILNYFLNVRAGLCGALPPLFGVPACVWREYVKATDSVALRYNRNDLPTLFIGLGLDFNVPPAELIRFQNDVYITDDFWSIPDLNHFMTPNDDPHVSMTLTDTIIYWLRQNNFATSISNEVPMENYIQVYPNPFQSEVLINVDGDFRNASCSVYNIYGHMVSYKEYIDLNYSASIDLSSLTGGMYFIELNVDGNRIIKKIIKE